MADKSVADDPIMHQFVAPERVDLGLTDRADRAASGSLDIPFDICSPVLSVGIGEARPTGAWETDTHSGEGTRTLILKSKSGVGLAVHIAKATGYEEDTVLEAGWNAGSSPEALTAAIEEVAREARESLADITKVTPERLRGELPSAEDAERMSAEAADECFGSLIGSLDREIAGQHKSIGLAEAERKAQAKKTELEEAILALLKRAYESDGKRLIADLEAKRAEGDILKTLRAYAKQLKEKVVSEQETRGPVVEGVAKWEQLEGAYRELQKNVTDIRYSDAAETWRQLRELKRRTAAAREEKLAGLMGRSAALRTKLAEAKASSSIPVTVKAKRSGAILGEVYVKVGM